MRIVECIWLDQFVDKIIEKHQVYPVEVQEAFENLPHVRKVEKGDVKGEDLYMAFGRSHSGRYLSILFVQKKENRALIISARDMSKSERKSYGRTR